MSTIRHDIEICKLDIERQRNCIRVFLPLVLPYQLTVGLSRSKLERAGDDLVHVTGVFDLLFPGQWSFSSDLPFILQGSVSASNVVVFPEFTSMVDHTHNSQ